MDGWVYVFELNSKGKQRKVVFFFKRKKGEAVKCFALAKEEFQSEAVNERQTASRGKEEVSTDQ